MKDRMVLVTSHSHYWTLSLLCPISWGSVYQVNSLRRSPFTGVDTVPFVVEVEVAPVLGSLGVILEAQLNLNTWEESMVQGDGT